jgi:hypothetical protein
LVLDEMVRKSQSLLDEEEEADAELWMAQTSSPTY